MFNLFFGSADEDNVPVVCVTLLGATGSGKTSLANSWVSNVCPPAHVPTEVPTLYYRTLRLSGPGEDDDLTTVLVEVEDTPSPLAVPAANEPQISPTSLRPTTPRSSWRLENIKAYMDCKREHAAAAAALSDCEAPQPRTHSLAAGCRMGFIVVFDCQDEGSLSAAKMILNHLIENASEENMQQVYLVANKIDKDPNSQVRHKVLQSGRQYAALKGVPFVEVSAMEFTRVRKLFRDILDHFAEQITSAGGGSKSRKSTKDAKEDCAVQ
eukprot:TRINITY_DN273_c0_g2_i1.p1 TRINITY_DN273_c0_g2~~TRINITY_DN273_c0_g2_i1.p1  ORF type:complete len:268 (+),score=69.69 TRINITY_DN273_c0_g2_i1:114-917(+)